ncbi:MAG: Xaa-Pro aminopeptidase [Bacteroidetes bacterium QH_2_63_10]|nr:MAG: Xaa-Pro aminopeptidase [Bacteroidetes bacterium QH_2_63_10]
MFDASTYRSRRRTLIDREHPESGLVLPLVVTDGHGLPVWEVVGERGHGVDRLGRRGAVDEVFAVPDRDRVVQRDGSAGVGLDPEGLEDVVWSGEHPSLREVATAAGIDSVAPVSDLEATLTTGREQGRAIHFLPPYRAEHRVRYESLLGIQNPRLDAFASVPLIRAVVAQRSVKSAEEIAQIEDALDWTARLHEYAQRHAAPGTSEQEIMGGLTGLLAAEGRTFSFNPTCSIHGEILHNHSYTNTLSEGDLFLVDAGAASPLHYAGDITRVTPVGGPFSARQRAIYEAVLAAQEAAIEALAPGVPFKDIHLLAARTLTEHLVDIGLMQGDPEEAVATGAHALFFPHGLGHMMGLDVHDMESLGEDYVGYADDQTRSEQFGLHTLRLARPLQPGFVATVEPGCYFISPLVERWRSKGRHQSFINYDRVEDFLGLGGVRIEDDVLITEDGARVLGPALPKAPDAVEAQAGSAVHA